MPHTGTSAWIAMALAARSMTSPRKRLVKSCTSRFRGEALFCRLEFVQGSWLIGESGIAIQPCVLAAARLASPGGDVWP
jgi:hypothetical protein